MVLNILLGLYFCVCPLVFQVGLLRGHCNHAGIRAANVPFKLFFFFGKIAVIDVCCISPGRL